MKRILLLVTIFALALCGSVQASSCVNGLFSTYDSPTFSCNIADLVFSNFVYTSTGTNTVAPIDSAVQVKVISGGPETGFQFVAGWAADPAAEEDSLIEYTVTCDGCSITDWALTVGSAGASGNAFVNVTETAAQLLGSLKVGANSTISVPTDSQTIPPQGTLDLSKDIHVNGGTIPSLGAQVSSVTNLFSTTQTTMTPEPSLLLLCAGLLGLLPVARRTLRRA